MTDDSPTVEPPPTFELDAATAVEPTGPAGTFAFTVDAGFTVGPKPNGGYLLATAARAVGVALADAGSAHRDPLAATAHYLWAPDPGPATIAVEVLRTGRSASQVRAVIEQDGRRCVDLTLTVGTLAVAPAVWTRAIPVDVAPIEDCVRIPSRREGSDFVVSTMDRVDLRLDPATMGFAFGAPSGRGELAGWIDLPDGRPIDPLALLLLLDTLPPATLDIGPSGWVPTLSLTAYLRSLPVPGRSPGRAAAPPGRPPPMPEYPSANARKKR